MEDIIIVGYGGHGKSVADTIELAERYRIVGYTDIHAHEGAEYSYLGRDESLENIFQKGISYAAIGLGYMGNSKIRNKLFNKLKKIGYKLPVIIDSTAVVSPKAKISEGTFVGKNVSINAYACIGKNCIINTGAVIEHECQIGNESHIAVGTVVCGQSRVGNYCFVGANSTVVQCRSIGENSIIGAGSVVINDVPDRAVAVGNPAKVIKYV